MTIKSCARCGSVLRDERSGWCAVCLLRLAADEDADASAPTTRELSESRALRGTPRLAAGQRFGAYRIERLLGRGGMGEVYEAEHLEHGRRVAVKLLNERLAAPEDRARFLREGQLAASVQHPNCVYVFGAEEILGVAAIAMELLPGGTLKDRVERDGPMDPFEAVDAILQVIAGLDAAHQAGVLHRDVKPSNCFVDLDGTVKIGDFGLSISTTMRYSDALTETGTIRATPQFAAPEQLKGQPLDERADIYAVGATLYFLLTGAAPFVEESLVALIARVLSDSPPSARQVNARVPRGLDRAIARCLAKEPADRPSDYRTLYDELRPFSTESPRPATLPVRVAAGAIDQLALLPFTGPLFLGAYSSSAGAQAWAFVLQVLYFAGLERGWGGTLGKRLCGLRVVSTRHSARLSVWAAAGRAVVYTAAWHASPLTLSLSEGVLHGAAGLAVRFLALCLSYVLIGVLFISARRTNGFASIYDLFTSTRVVVRTKQDAIDAPDLATPSLSPAVHPESFGPYRVLGQLSLVEHGRLLVASDDLLQRRVWVHEVRVPAAPVSHPRRSVGRPTRLRWLTGVRTSSGGWDAYGAPEGAAYTHITAEPQPWRRVRRWLAGLAREVQVAVAEGTAPRLSPESVWVSRRGEPILLDFPIGEQSPHLAEPDLASIQDFLRRIASIALMGNAGATAAARPLPIQARQTLARTANHEFATCEELTEALEALVQAPDTVSRRRRAASLLVPAAPLALMGMGVALAFTMFTSTDGSADLLHWLDERAALEDADSAGTARQREALDVYLAGLYGSDLRSARFWKSSAGRARATARPLVQRVLEAHPTVSSSELARASAVLQPEIDAYQRRGWTRALNEVELTRVMLIQLLIVAAIACITASMTRGGVVLRLWGIAATTRTGAPVTRLRALGRALVAWSPIIAAGALVLGLDFSSRADVIVTMIAAAVWACGAAYALTTPDCGFQDIVAGTWLVPR